MLIAIAGSQGTGKTTILNDLKDQGHNIICRKTARSVLNEMGVSLDCITCDPLKVMEFQDRLLDRKLNDEAHVVNTKEIYFTERTCLDLLVYTVIYIGKLNVYNDWLDAYAARCIAGHKESCKRVFYLHGGKFNIEHDGVRAINQYYSKAVDLYMHDLIKEHTRWDSLIDIQVSDHDTRILQIIQNI